MVFLVDGSWSVGRPNFKYIRNFISAAAGAFKIGEDKTRVGVVQYSRDPRTEFYLRYHMTRPALLRAIGSLPYKGGDTMTGLSIMSFNVWRFLHSFFYFHLTLVYFLVGFKWWWWWWWLFLNENVDLHKPSLLKWRPSIVRSVCGDGLLTIYWL